jgi:hypothetical protein
MTKHTKREFSLTVLKEQIKLLDKIELTKLVLDCLSKEDLLDAILNSWTKQNIATNNRIENFFQKKWKSEKN